MDEFEATLNRVLSDPAEMEKLSRLAGQNVTRYVYELESDGLLRITRTAGLDVVRIENPTMTKECCLANYYEMLD